MNKLLGYLDVTDGVAMFNGFTFAAIAYVL